MFAATESLSTMTGVCITAWATLTGHPSVYQRRVSLARHMLDTTRPSVDLRGLALAVRGVIHLQRAQGLVEYALVLMLISIVAVAIMTVLGVQTNSLYELASNSIVAP